MERARRLLSLAFFSCAAANTCSPHRTDRNYTCSECARPYNTIQLGNGRALPRLFKVHNDYWHTWPERKLAVFTIPKVGTSSMRVFTIPPHGDLTNATNPPIKDIQTYFFALLMRDPLERLISAFEDTRNIWIRNTISKSLFPECTDGKRAPDPARAGQCTFGRFVHAVAQSHLYSNDHYNLQVRLADPHRMRYDFVGLLDSDWDRDFMYNRLLNASKVHLNARNSANVQNVCAEVTPAVHQVVRELYHEDYAFIDSLARSTPKACTKSCRKTLELRGVP
mmetsp:Transcript_26328/g.43719  ORF Transcript_26328/g.43719 Transcript_26328/m.43719 type:complete len:280 (-) Transcript_26328:547-1386(-)